MTRDKLLGELEIVLTSLVDVQQQQMTSAARRTLRQSHARLQKVISKLEQGDRPIYPLPLK